MTAAEWARLITYAGGVIGGLVCIVFGAARGDLALIAAGAGLVTMGGVAGPNVPRSRGKYAE